MKIMLRFKLGVAVIVLSTALSTASLRGPCERRRRRWTPCGRGRWPSWGGWRWAAGGWRSSWWWWPWRACMSAAAILVAGRAVRISAAAVGASHQRQTRRYNHVRKGLAQPKVRTKCKIEQEAVHNSCGPHSGEQLGRRKDASQVNRERNAQREPHREPKPQISRRANTPSTPHDGRRRIAQNRNALRHPNNRAHITASAAMAGWHNGSMAMAGGDTGMAATDGSARRTGRSPTTTCMTTRCGAPVTTTCSRATATGDIYAGIFAPYGYDDLTGYLQQRASSDFSDVGQPAPAPVAPPRSARSARRKCAARIAAISPACQSIRIQASDPANRRTKLCA